ncbi:DUF475 domain-containing protein [Candidatus Parcubacteria bacterium]|nr:DUF475 domain-containing protein [Candidatus Parcubacteria bacterium]
MPAKKPSLLKIYALSTFISALLIAFVGFKAGWAALFLVLVLVALEITFSVDNAVINTKILQRLSPGWQQAFLTIGILIAVFGVRVFLPLLIVSMASGLSMGGVVDLALNNPDEYGHRLEDSHVAISSFGGMFLLMIFLDFFFQRRRTKWLIRIETIMERAGRLVSLSVVLSLTTLLVLSNMLDNTAEQTTALTSGVIGLVAYLLINSLDTLLGRTNINKNLQKTAQNTFKAGLIGFIYLNIIDASFSLDGVIGAFAITNQILLIAVGLGVGALYVRVLTIHMLRHGVLQKYRYMEHGAHYAIGILAMLMLSSLIFHIPEAVAGLAGIAFVGTAVLHSYLERKREEKAV